MKLSETKLKGCYIIEPSVMTDDRGFFFRTFCDNEFKEIGFNKSIVNLKSRNNISALSLKNYFSTSLFFLILNLQFLIFNSTLAQPSKTDSLLKLLETSKEDTNKVNLLNELCIQYNHTAPDRALQFANLGLSLAEIKDYKKGMGNILNNGQL